MNFNGMKSDLDNNLEDGDLDKIEILIIDVLLLLLAIFNNKNFKTFFTSLGFIEKAEEIAINLANKSFNYFFFIIGNVLPNYMNSTYTICNPIDINPFAYIPTNQYSSIKFYRIIIDTSTSKYFIAYYRQYMAYTRDIKNTAIHIAKAAAVYIQFGIDLILFIGSIIIQIPIEYIKFDIIKVNTLFFLCFVDINRLNIYFNNINNSLVMKSIYIPIICHLNHLFLL